jgi:hypothetical protein
MSGKCHPVRTFHPERILPRRSADRNEHKLTDETEGNSFRSVRFEKSALPGKERVRTKT